METATKLQVCLAGVPMAEECRVLEATNGTRTRGHKPCVVCQMQLSTSRSWNTSEPKALILSPASCLGTPNLAGTCIDSSRSCAKLVLRPSPTVTNHRQHAGSCMAPSATNTKISWRRQDSQPDIERAQTPDHPCQDQLGRVGRFPSRLRAQWPFLASDWPMNTDMQSSSA
jgi:hypothetical protein